MNRASTSKTPKDLGITQVEAKRTGETESGVESGDIIIYTYKLTAAVMSWTTSNQRYQSRVSTNWMQ